MNCFKNELSNKTIFRIDYKNTAYFQSTYVRNENNKQGVSFPQCAYKTTQQ